MYVQVRIGVSLADLPDCVKVGGLIRIQDGLINIEVTSVRPSGPVCGMVLNHAFLYPRKVSASYWRALLDARMSLFMFIVRSNYPTFLGLLQPGESWQEVQDSFLFARWSAVVW